MFVAWWLTHVYCYDGNGRACVPMNGRLILSELEVIRC